MEADLRAGLLCTESPNVDVLMVELAEHGPVAN
jgi:hypothetical protein